MDDQLIQREFEKNERYFFDRANWQLVQHTRSWARTLPAEAGVYMLFDSDDLIYVGETGKLSGRALDLLDTRNHTIRRAIGSKLFAHHAGYQKATASVKHPSHIEALVTSKMSELYLCARPFRIGRKEFEEYIVAKYAPVFNRSLKRV